MREIIRLKYTKSGKEYRSEPFLLGCEVCHIVINMTTKRYRIVDVKTEKYCFGEGGGSTKQLIQKDARESLFRCSVSLISELKPKKKGKKKA